MLQYNTMRFGTDEFAFNKQALLVAKVPFDTTDQTSVEGFQIDYTQPTNSLVRVLFKVDDKIYRFDDQSLSEVSITLDADNVLEFGNTVAELAGVASVPDWLNKKIYPIIALQSPAEATIMPALKLGLKVRSANDVYERTAETAEIELGGLGGENVPRIIDAEATTTLTGRGVVNIQARVRNNETWGDWMAIQALKDIDAQAVQFKIRYTVSQINGEDSVKVDKIVVRHTQGTAVVSGDNAEIYSIIADYEHGLQTCAAAVRHKKLIDSKIGAYVNFTHPTKRRTFYPIGLSNGANQTLVLGERDKAIDPGTLKLFAEGKPIVNFSYNTEVSEVTINVAAGQAITASYEYDREPEVWREMTIDVDQQPYDDGTYLTRFTYTLPDEELDNQTVTNIRLQLYRTNGNVVGEVLGTATGNTQQFVLKHAAKAETLNINAEFSYDEDSQIVTLIAPTGTELVADYDWIGESHTVYSFVAAWSPAV